MGIVERIPQALNAAFFSPGVYVAVASLSLILATWESADRTQDKLQQTFESKEDTFDFIVVGSGSAGAVVAYRLSEFFSVLLLEAGGTPHILQSIPGFALFLPNHPYVDWMHQSIPQRRSCFACSDGRVTFSQGKSLGGSSNLNMMLHSRGNFRDFDNWAKITGDPAWSYEGVLPFFKRYEDFYGNTTDPYSHGVGGRVRIEVPDYRGMADEFIWAANELGYPQSDLNGRYGEGFDHAFYPIKNGVRQGAYSAFIQPGKHRASLTIRKFAQVNKVLTRGKYNEAYAVSYDRHGQTRLAYARKEIILSAGAIQTSKILLLSGIGPKEHLKDLGIPVVADLPVGMNLQDHASTFLGPFLMDKPRSFLVDREVTPKAFADWTVGRGPLTTTGIQAVGFITSSLAKERGEWDWPDMQHNLLGVSVHKTFAKDTARAYGLKEDVLEKYYDHAVGKEAFTIITSNSRPVARGEVRLSGSDPNDPLIIDPRYFEDKWDLDIKVSVEAMKIAIKMVEETRSFASLNARFTNEVFPGCEKYLFRSDEYFECYQRQYTVTLNHPSGTCAMGAPNSPHSCVDTQLRLLGVKHVRVIDSSVMPTIPVSSTQAATIMIGEKGADMILEHWKSQQVSLTDHHVYGNLGNSYQPGVALVGLPSRPLSLLESIVKPAAITPLYETHSHAHGHELSHGIVVEDTLTKPTVVLKDSHSPVYDLNHYAYRLKRDLFNKNIRGRLRNITVDSFPVKKGAKSQGGPYSLQNATEVPLVFSQVLAKNSPLADDDDTTSSSSANSKELIKSLVTSDAQNKIKKLGR